MRIEIGNFDEFIIGGKCMKCPVCKGIWLDRGELEKLIEKEEVYNREHYEHKCESKEYRDDRYDDKYPRRRKKESFMGEIFDIFGGD